jgi:hypothetical protein
VAFNSRQSNNQLIAECGNLTNIVINIPLPSDDAATVSRNRHAILSRVGDNNGTMLHLGPCAQRDHYPDSGEEEDSFHLAMDFGETSVSIYYSDHNEALLSPVHMEVSWNGLEWYRLRFK